MTKRAIALLVALIAAAVAAPAQGATVRLATDEAGALGFNYIAADGELNVIFVGDGPHQGNIRGEGGWTAIGAVAPCWVTKSTGSAISATAPHRGSTTYGSSLVTRLISSRTWGSRCRSSSTAARDPTRSGAGGALIF